MGRGEKKLLIVAAIVVLGAIPYYVIIALMAALQVFLPFIPDTQWSHRHRDQALLVAAERKCGSFFTTQVAQAAYDPTWEGVKLGGVE